MLWIQLLLLIISKKVNVGSFLMLVYMLTYMSDGSLTHLNFLYVIVGVYIVYDLLHMSSFIGEGEQCTSTQCSYDSF